MGEMIVLAAVVDPCGKVIAIDPLALEQAGLSREKGARRPFGGVLLVQIQHVRGGRAEARPFSSTVGLSGEARNDHALARCEPPTCPSAVQAPS